MLTTDSRSLHTTVETELGQQIPNGYGDDLLGTDCIQAWFKFKGPEQPTIMPVPNDTTEAKARWWVRVFVSFRPPSGGTIGQVVIVRVPH
eukprot:scaffold4330_cov38-Attheya_sp.AAC.2